MKERITYEMPSPTATAVVGLSHRGSRLECHAAAAMRQPYGGLMGVFAVVEQRNGYRPTQYYIHPDHLGSWTLVTNRSGGIEQDLAFDAWGTPYGFTATGTEPATSLMFDRGYTGHEHLNSFK